MSKANREVLIQFTRFAGVGAIGTAVHYLILILLVHAQQADPILSSACGFVGGAITNYLLNYHYTFNSEITHFLGLPKFLAVALAGLVLNSLVMTGAISLLQLHYLIAQVIATGIVLVWNFMGNRIWTFRDSSYGNSQ